MGKLVGIDLGTTNSVVATMDGPQPRVLDSKEGRRQTRSVISLKRRKGSGDGELIAGDPAFDNWSMCPEDTIVSVKRLMGRGVGDPEVQKVKGAAQFQIVEPDDGTKDSVRVVIGGRQYSPIEVSAMIIEKLKSDAEFRLGDEVTHAVITVPAYFSQIQKDATRKAGLKAGLHVIKILDEPTAAAIAYGLESDGGSDATTLIVYDLGGGTFDISVLMMAGGTFAPLDLEGDMWLGGDNFDLVLIDHALASLKEDYPGLDPTGKKRFMVELRRAAQKTKEALGASRSADLIVAGVLQDEDHNLIDLDLEITREQYEGMITPLVERTKSLVAKALRKANLTTDEVDCVLMAGNSTAIPLVQSTMEEMFGTDKVMRRIHPKECVAIGAAIVAAVIGPKVVCDCGQQNDMGATECSKCGQALADHDAEESGSPTPPPFEVTGGPTRDGIVTIAPFSYGAQGVGDTMTVFVNEGDPCPTAEPRMHVFRTQAPNARIISIPIYGGDDHEHASANELQGDAFAILPPGLPAHTPVHVKLWLDGDGVFKLSAELQSGQDLQPWVMVKGEVQQRAIEELEEAERLLGQKSKGADPRKLAAIDRLREEAFDHMRAGEFEKALEAVRSFSEAGDDLATPGASSKESPRDKAQRLLSFTGRILNEYGWAFDEWRRQEFFRITDETLEAARGKDEALIAAKAEELDRATDDLPEAVTVFLGLLGAIWGQVKPRDPAVAARLEGELDAINHAFAAGDASAVERLNALAGAIMEELGKIAPEGVECPKGHRGPAGKRYCPVCNHDHWGLIA